MLSQHKLNLDLAVTLIITGSVVANTEETCHLKMHRAVPVFIILNLDLAKIIERKEPP